MKTHTDRVLFGPRGYATEVLIDEVDVPDHAATLVAWFLDCPGQSPAWRHYLLSMVHLREMDGCEPVYIDVPGATHQLHLAALDPNRNPSAYHPSRWGVMLPINMCEQVELPDDESAVSLATECARAVVNGVLWAEPPANGMREPWLSVLVKSSAHARGEEHAP